MCILFELYLKDRNKTLVTAITLKSCDRNKQMK